LDLEKSDGGSQIGVAIARNPPTDVLTFVSDAAGVSLEWVNGQSKNTIAAGDRGVTAVVNKGD
jgi:hypothetical protein